MGCKFLDMHGTCTIYDEDIENPNWDENGYCLCEDNIKCQESCIDYEPDQSSPQDNE